MDTATQRFWEMGNEQPEPDRLYPTLDQWTAAIEELHRAEAEAERIKLAREAQAVAAAEREKLWAREQADRAEQAKKHAEWIQNRPRGVYCAACGQRSDVAHVCPGTRIMATTEFFGTSDSLSTNATSDAGPIVSLLSHLGGATSDCGTSDYTPVPYLMVRHGKKERR